MDACARCAKPVDVCVCAHLSLLAVTTPLLILQHPQEQDHVLGTVPVLGQMVPVTVRVGLSWPNLAAALGRPAPSGRWALVFPKAGVTGRFDARGAPVADPFDGLVLLDGTWSQAKTLRWRNPWLARLGRISLEPSEASIYGRLRREPDRRHVSTLEAAADALVANGEPADTAVALRRALRRMAQRIRDRG